MLKFQSEITDEHRFWQKLLLFPQGALSTKLLTDCVKHNKAK